MSSSKPLVIVIGGTGNTGGSIVNGILKRDTFDVAILVRPGSVEKPATLALKEQGVHIRVGDIVKDDVSKLTSLVEGFDVVICAVVATSVGEQRNIIAASKAAGVKRFIPCDFGTFTPKGVRAMMDEKYEIREYIEELHLDHTFIDVGWWMEITLPYSGSPDGFLKKLSYKFSGDGDKKLALTSLPDIGHFVARIIEDPRTLNRYVFVWGQEFTLAEVWEIAQRVSGEDFEAKKVHVSADELLSIAAEGKEKFLKFGDFVGYGLWSHSEYAYSMHIRGDNAVANAVAAGALDARVLYPDVKPKTLEEVARDFYANPPTFWDF